MIVLRLALKSLLNRWITALLTVGTIAASVVLLLGVEEVRTGARQSFADTISGTDLIVGARSGTLNLLLYSVFRIGNATNNVTWQSYQDIARRPEVAWIVPLSLGDSHHGFRVLGTTADYFAHYKFRRGQGLDVPGRQAVLGPVRRRHRRRCGGEARLQGRRSDRGRARARLRLVRGARRQAVPRRGHPGADRHAG